MFKLGISAGMRLPIAVEEQLPIIRDVGFDSFFTSWSPTHPIELWADIARKTGLIYETLHAPFNKMNDMWLDGVAGDDYCDMLMSCVNTCADNGISTMITHVTVATVAPPVSEIGALRFGQIIELAEKRNVKIAFENLEIPEHLAFLLGRYKDSTNVGFCWDCGHNNCYTPDIDMMELYSNRLICTHLHDNLGVKTAGIITWHDDLHYLPFDGNIDFKNATDKIKRSKFSGILTLELNSQSKPQYKEMTPRAFIEEAYSRAKSIKKLCE